VRFLLIFALCSWPALAQSNPEADSNMSCVERLQMPVYPPLAQQARISGQRYGYGGCDFRRRSSNGGRGGTPASRRGRRGGAESISFSQQLQRQNSETDL
jgi:hypothetical protein